MASLISALTMILTLLYLLPLAAGTPYRPPEWKYTPSGPFFEITPMVDERAVTVSVPQLTVTSDDPLTITHHAVSPHHTSSENLHLETIQTFIPSIPTPHSAPHRVPPPGIGKRAMHLTAEVGDQKPQDLHTVGSGHHAHSLKSTHTPHSAQSTQGPPSEPTSIPHFLPTVEWFGGRGPHPLPTPVNKREERHETSTPYTFNPTTLQTETTITLPQTTECITTLYLPSSPFFHVGTKTIWTSTATMYPEFDCHGCPSLTVVDPWTIGQPTSKYPITKTIKSVISVASPVCMASPTSGGVTLTAT
jgi:hypothetical protein